MYVKWLQHFIKETGASLDMKVLLILDNHESHITLQSWELCRNNGVVVVSLPPHCSHKCQPLDLTIFGPLKTAYYKRCCEWMRMNPGKRITQYDVAALFGDAYCSTSSIQKCVNGFKSAGIYPLNSSVFSDEDFRAAENLMAHSTQEAVDTADTTSAPTPAATATAGSTAEAASTADTNPTPGSTMVTDGVTVEAVSITDTTSAPTPAATVTAGATVEAVMTATTVEGVTDARLPTHPEKRVSVLDISPIPKAIPRDNTRKRKCKRSEILTGTPVKRVLEARMQKQAEKASKANERQRKKQLKFSEENHANQKACESKPKEDKPKRSKKTTKKTTKSATGEIV